MHKQTSDSAYKTANDILMYYINHGNLENGYALLRDREVSLEIKNNLGMTPLLVIQLYCLTYYYNYCSLQLRLII